MLKTEFYLNIPVIIFASTADMFGWRQKSVNDSAGQLDDTLTEQTQSTI